VNWKKLVVVVGAVLSVSIICQNQSTQLMAQTVDEKKLVALHGTVHPLAQPQYDQGTVSDGLPMQRLLLTLARPADREKDLQQFLQDVHSPGSPNYHKWLTPDEYGTRFGAVDVDIQVVSDWLQSHGFSVARIARNKSIIEFSGTAGQIREALHTEMHQYNIQGTAYYANSSDISVPEEISSRISGFAPLNSFPFDSYVRLLGGGAMNPANHRVAPQFTIKENKEPFYAFGPEDFATQYDVIPVYASGINGSGQTIGVIETANINLAMLAAYRQLFSLPADHTQVIIDGQDPGDPMLPNIEGYLDAEVSGAVAPNATVNFYIAGGDPFEDPLSLAALRAVEDNQASVLSLSFGECEQELGEAGNRLWAGLWQQAAAQGQTVFVSSGDSGPTTCQPSALISGTYQFTNTVNVNGFSSTPWNVSVGGTDFFYSDYATGALSSASYWNQTNDSSNGSLKAPLTEQPWDNSLGLDVSGAYEDSAAGGGGPSNCSQTTVPLSGALPTCIAGYPKPSWQYAPGVPNDQVRDLPDVSLFASNGVNLSAAPVCGEPGDCAAVASGYPQVTLVGGTSASSPAMAGILALVNQKYGRQGQANFTLYTLARQFPNVFHDITLGTNDIACPPNTYPDCNVLVAADHAFDSYGKYAAGPGYDMASGLGSVDVNQLVSNWDNVTFEPSSTTLQATPSSIVHGTVLTVNVAVKASSGSATPTGNVVLEAGAATTIPVNSPLTLTGGSSSASLTNLPGGSYPLTAQYSGDGSFASSSSAPISLTVSPEASSTALSYTYSSLSQLPKGQVPFGGNVIVTATPASLATKTTGLATGTVTFTDTASSATATSALDSNGIAAWNPQNLAIGAHSITASYSGDASYKTSTSTPLALTVVKGSPSFTAVPEVSPANFNSSGEVFQVGTNLIVHVLLGTPGTGTAPSGTVTVNFGALQQTVAVTPNAYLNENLSTAFITFTNIAAGTYSLNASYSGDSNWNSATYTYFSQLTYANAGALATTTALAITPSSVVSSGSVTFNVTVQVPSSLNGAPAGNVLLYANGTVFGEIELATGSGLTASGVETIPASEIPYGSLQVIAEYTGGFPGFDPSVSSPVPLTVTATDFSLSVAGKNLAVPSGQSLTVPVSLGGPSSAGVTVGLTCLPSSAGISCSISPGSANFTGTGTASLTINAFAITNVAAISHVSGRDRGRVASGNAVAIALVFLLLLPTRKRLKMSMLLAFYAAMALTTGCGGGASSTSSRTQSTNAPAGSYSIVVSGVSAGITHQVALNLTVQ
jgi:hypothetical protein